MHGHSWPGCQRARFEAAAAVETKEEMAEASNEKSAGSERSEEKAQARQQRLGMPKRDITALVVLLTIITGGLVLSAYYVSKIHPIFGVIVICILGTLIGAVIHAIGAKPQSSRDLTVGANERLLVE
jgi:hypothetical protein